MTKSQTMVKEFMRSAKQACPVEPAVPPLEVRKLRVRLIAEELVELAEAYNVYLEIDGSGGVSVGESGYKDETFCNLTGAYDATLDLKYVVEGNGVALGVDLEPGFAEVHRVNMTKTERLALRADGKVAKSTTCETPNLEPILEAQRKVLTSPAVGAKLEG